MKHLYFVILYLGVVCGVEFAGSNVLYGEVFAQNTITNETDNAPALSGGWQKPDGREYVILFVS
jgi:hypothetical protein